MKKVLSLLLALVMIIGMMPLATLTAGAAEESSTLALAGTTGTLASDKYLAEEGEQYGFLLRHSTGNKNRNSEVDVPLTYADYYFLEALLRWQQVVK